MRNERHQALQCGSFREVSRVQISQARLGEKRKRFYPFFPLFTYLSLTRCFFPTLLPSQSQRKKISGKRKGA